MSVYYNEYDKKKAAWLRQLIEEGVIAHGVVDDRPIQAVQPDDLVGFVQCHFFAGVGLWSHCLRRAGWPDDKSVWTGSCPCGPFSGAGLRKGFDDPRHLWPEWFRLKRVCRPNVVFGEQSADAELWLDLVSSDLESIGYAIGAIDLPAAGFGGAHRRQRFGFVADTDNTEWWSDRAPWHDGQWPKTGRVESYRHIGDGGASFGLVNPPGSGCRLGTSDNSGIFQPDPSRPTFRLGDAGGSAGERISRKFLGEETSFYRARLVDGRGGVGPSDADALDWLYCRDQRWRPVEPGTCPLADAHPSRMVLLHSYGDAIDVEAFTNLIGAYLDCAPARAAA